MTLADIEEVVFLDFEFRADTGERPIPVCFVARELRNQRVFRRWIERKPPRLPPFATGRNVVVVAYYASAEMGCYLALNWPLPGRVLDLFTEFRVATNGLALPHGRGVLGAMQWFGLNGIEAWKKDYFRKRTLAGGPYNSDEREAILGYCESDVIATEQLFPKLISGSKDISPVLLRGDYMKAVARAEHLGVPIDAALYRQMVERWPDLQASIIERVNTTISVFESSHFRVARFEAWLKSRGLLADWPQTTSGDLALNEDVFREQAALHPEIEPLRQVRQMLGQLHKPALSVGRDGRNRCLLSPFKTKTGRNAPSTTKYIFGAPSFMRGLIRPEPGRALAYLDYSSQEFGIAVALSGDLAMKAAYDSGDCYLAFAKLAGAVPQDATKESHPRERALFKTTALQIQYLIGANGLALKLGITLPEAEDLLEHHRRVFSRFWKWSDAALDYYQLYAELPSIFGWTLHLSRDASMRSLRNFPMQANGAEMLRLASIFATAEGASISAMVHDALLIEAAEGAIEEAASVVERAMRRASEVVLSEFPLRTEAKIIRPGQRFQDERGVRMWQWMQEALGGLVA
jgi:hypothetical protein